MSGYSMGQPAPRLSPFPDKLSPLMREYLTAGVSVNFPPQGFDPRRASDRELEDHFVARRPDAKTSPQAFALWEQAMSGPPIWPDSSEDALALDRLFGQTTLLSYPRLAGPSNASFEASSANWSGGYARPRGSGHMNRVQGLWIVPDPVPPLPGAGEYASSAWVGLDGHDAASRSLVQIGSGQWVTADSAGGVAPNLFTWWQWFVRDGQYNGQIIIKAVPVAPGDVIYAQVDAVSLTQAFLLIINLTSNLAFPFAFGYVDPIQPILSPTNPLPAHIEGRTAEWILERPAHVHDPMLYSLPNYGATAFLACYAGTDAAGPAQQVDFHRARLMRMVDWQVPPRASKVVSSPARLGTTGIKVHYGP